LTSCAPVAASAVVLEQLALGKPEDNRPRGRELALGKPVRPWAIGIVLVLSGTCVHPVPAGPYFPNQGLRRPWRHLG
jgi:hypothetical protein